MFHGWFKPVGWRLLEHPTTRRPTKAGRKGKTPARPGFGFVIVDYEIISQNTKANTANGGKALHSTFHIAS